MHRRISIRGRVRPSVRPAYRSVRMSHVIFKGEKYAYYKACLVPCIRPCFLSFFLFFFRALSVFLNPTHKQINTLFYSIKTGFFYVPQAFAYRPIAMTLSTKQEHDMDKTNTKETKTETWQWINTLEKDTEMRLGSIFVNVKGKPDIRTKQREEKIWVAVGVFMSIWVLSLKTDMAHGPY